MAIDSPVLETAELSSSLKPGAIDFSSSPETPKPYTFGEPVSRDNFTSFLLESFAKSRGNMSAQAMYLKYLDQHSGTPVNLVLDNFIDAGGFEALSANEKNLITQTYAKVREHRPISQLENDMDDTNFDEIFSSNIMAIQTILENPGREVLLGGNPHRVGRFNQSILNLSKDDFLKWLTQYGPGYIMLERIYPSPNNSADKKNS